MQVTRTTLSDIEAFRAQFLKENKIQFIHNKCHLYGWADNYLFTYDGAKVGYGSVWGTSKREDRDTIFEFFLTEPFRSLSSLFFEKFIAASGVMFMDCQTNDKFSAPMFDKFATDVYTEAILFEDHVQTNFQIANTNLQPVVPDAHTSPDDRQFVLKHNDEKVGGGGFMLNYNFPYADIYYNVMEPFRRKGFGTLIVQELKKEVYRIGRVPAARCNAANSISKATLLKGGFRICGEWLGGKVGIKTATPKGSS
jgi:GNAT superfamily N-acetyltransferase